MDDYPLMSSLVDEDVNNFPDLNYVDKTEGASGGEEQLFEESCFPNSEEIQATNEVESTNLTVEEMENRLAIGRMVENEHIAYALYCKYARAKGFSVRRGKNIYFKDGCGLLQGKFFLCSCAGGKDNKSSKSQIPKYQKTTFRCDCKAGLKIARRKGEEWRVTRFQKEHKHEMYAPGQTYLLRSARKLTDQQELLLNTMVKSRIPVSKAITFLENVAQGRENVGCTSKDVYDYLSRTSRKKKIENEDTIRLFQHFTNKSNDESNFYCSMEVDSENRLVSFFVRDYRCSIDYEHFGDVLSIDTTYSTNRYDLKCAPFTGINHHNQNIMFGIAFISDESQSSFEWLFRTFLKSMGNKQPETVFTDQCQAMMNAVETVFPCAHHRLCQWHISQNAPSHFGNLNNDSNFIHMWTKCMSHCDSEEEFELTWKEMETIYKINEESWFNMMYNLRHKWATAFSNHVFSAGLLTTSRSECTNSALKTRFGNKTSYLIDCVLEYEQLQENWRVREKEKDTLGHHNEPSLFAPRNPLLRHASNVYTLNIYNLFAKELHDTIEFEQPQQYTYEGSSLTLFKVKLHGESSRIRIVEYDSTKFEIKCTCNKFETTGILCSHALKVLGVLNMPCLPEKYIKKRWTKDIKGGVCDGPSVFVSGNGGNNSYVNEIAFVNHITKEVHDLAMEGKANMEMRDFLIEYVERGKEKWKTLQANKKVNNSTVCHNSVPGEDSNHVDEMLVRDPLVAKSRGINIQRRHWDCKRKKGKGKANSSKRIAKGAKRKGQSSQTLTNGCPSQEAIIAQQFEPFQNQMPFGAMIGMAHDIYGHPNTFGFVNVLQPQEQSNGDWVSPE